jgi:hypothetical protein
MAQSAKTGQAINLAAKLLRSLPDEAMSRRS